jgi:RNA polymerase sigma factor (sigma-70 family)
VNTINVEDYVALVWSIYKKVKPRLPLYEPEDWIQLGLMTINEVAKTYDPTKASVTTFLYMKIKQSWLRTISNETNTSKIPTMMVVKMDDLDQIVCDPSGQIVDRLIHEDLIKKLGDIPFSNVEQLLLQNILGCITQREIADMLGVSRSTVSYRMMKLKRRISDIIDKKGGR